MATMTVPPSTQWKKLPPTGLSRSLEGLEIGIPPGAVRSKDPAIPINNLWLWKPLPKLPQRESSVYSRESIIDNYMDRNDKDESTYIQPDFIRSEPDVAQQSIKPPAAPSQVSLADVAGQEKRGSLMIKAFVTEEQYGMGMHLAKANHYFREKKWEIFPELAPQPAVRTLNPSSRSRKWAFHRKRHQTESYGHTSSESDGFALNLDPIRTYVKKTLSKKSSQLKMKNNASESSVAFHSRRRKNSISTASEASIETAELQRSLAHVRNRMQTLSLWSHSSDDSSVSTNLESWRQPTAAFKNPSRRSGPKRRPRPTSKLVGQKAPGIRFVKYRRSPSLKEGRKCPDQGMPSPSTSSQSSQSSHPTSSRSEHGKMLQQGTHAVLSAIDGAKKKIAESRAARRRAELKKHIRVIGPIEHYPDGTVNQWL
jgi:hypothetical protein